MQSSWTKEVDSSQEASSRDQIAKCSDGTCAQLHSNAEISNGKLLPVIAPKEFQELEEQIGMHEHTRIFLDAVAVEFFQ